MRLLYATEKLATKQTMWRLLHAHAVTMKQAISHLVEQLHAHAVTMKEQLHAHAVAIVHRAHNFWDNSLAELGAGPIAFLICCIVVTTLWACVMCARCRIRDCAIIKRLFLLTGHDRFNDVDIMVLVHEAMFDDVAAQRLNLIVKITAGDNFVKTEANSRGIFQQPMHITVEQGTTRIVVELLDTWNNLLAVLPLDVEDHILNEKNLQPEVVYSMKQKSKNIRNPRVKLTMVVEQDTDPESGMISDSRAPDIDFLVRQQLRKAKANIGSKKHVSELDVLKDACAGPLEIFEGLGDTVQVYVAVIGTPISRRWILGVWNDQEDYNVKKQPRQEIDLMRIQSIQADPMRNHVFVVHCLDETRVQKSLTFRRVDRNRDVWVEILRLLVMKARETVNKIKASRTSNKDKYRESPSRNRFGFRRADQGDHEDRGCMTQ